MRYRMTLSNKEVLELSQEDYNKFEQHSGSGNFVKLTSGVVNPSFVVSITPFGKETPKYESLPTVQGLDPRKFRPRFMGEIETD